MVGKGIAKKVAGPAPVKLLDNIPVGDLRDELIKAISLEVCHCDNFSPCNTWTEHKHAKRVDTLWNSMKVPWGLPECKETKDWFNETARGRWSDFKTRNLKPYFDSVDGNLVETKANCPHFIDALTWEQLCNNFAKISDAGMDPNGQSKSQKCKDARNAVKMNHSLGRTSLSKWKDKHNDVFGKLSNVPVTFDKQYLRIDSLEQHGSSSSNPDVESEPPTGVTLNTQTLLISEKLHQSYDNAIKDGSDESNANTKTLLEVFGGSKRRLGYVTSKSNNKRSKSVVDSNQQEIDKLRKEVAQEKRKREELEGTIGMLMGCLQKHGMMPQDLTDSTSTNHQTESTEEHA